jgi:RNA polymerase subunit RPABC4/transcription elongation factor Spt4
MKPEWWVCKKCGTMLSHKCKCPYCGGETVRAQEVRK